MIPKTTVAVLVLAFFFFAGCASSSPDEPAGSRKKFPSSRYLTATGVGKTEGEARRQAMSEIANIFESKVMSETNSSALSVVSDIEGESFQKTVGTKIRILSSVQLKGVTIGDIWQEEGLYHAVAVLDRFQSQENWSREKEELTAALEGERNTLKTASSKIIRLTSANRIADLWLRRNVVQSRLAVIGFGDELENELDVPAIFKTISDIKSDLRFHLDISGENGSQVMQQIGRTLTRKGLFLKDAKEDSDVLVAGRISVEPIQLNNPDIHFVRADVSLQVVDRQTAAQIGEIAENIRKGHINAKEAARKAVQEVSVIAADKLLTLIGFAETPGD